jgi:hypothetical protein
LLRKNTGRDYVEVLQTRDDYQLVQSHDPLVLKLWKLAEEGKSWEQVVQQELTLVEKNLLYNRKTGVYNLIKYIESLKEPEEYANQSNRKRRVSLGAANRARSMRTTPRNKHSRLETRRVMEPDPCSSVPSTVRAARDASSAENAIELDDDDDSDGDEDIMEVGLVLPAKTTAAREVSLLDDDNVLNLCDDDSDDDDFMEVWTS